MFCSKCGKELTDGSSFCCGCGASLAVTEKPVPDKVIKSNSVEVTTINVDPEDEQEVIALHQKFGWIFKSTQEINTSYTDVQSHATSNGQSYVTSTVHTQHYIKLTFERYKDTPNYSVLRDKYDAFIKLFNEAGELKKSVNKRSKKFYLICAVPAIIVTILSIVILWNTLFSDMWFLDGFDIFMMIFLGLLLGVVSYLMSVAIGMLATWKKVKQDIAGKTDVLRREMYALANEAERYL